MPIIIFVPSLVHVQNLIRVFWLHRELPYYNGVLNGCQCSVWPICPHISEDSARGVAIDKDPDTLPARQGLAMEIDSEALRYLAPNFDGDEDYMRKTMKRLSSNLQYLA